MKRPVFIKQELEEEYLRILSKKRRIAIRLKIPVINQGKKIVRIRARWLAAKLTILAEYYLQTSIN